MLKDSSLQEVLESIENTRKTDILIDPKDIRTTGSRGGQLYFSAGNQDVDVYPHALSQMESGMLSGFSSYGRNLREAGLLDIYADNFNALMPRLNDPRMLRMEDVQDDRAKVRAFLSQKYERFDDCDVFGCLIDALEGNSRFSDDFKALGGKRTDMHTYIKLISRNPLFSVEADGRTRDFSMGLIFSNSEVGLGFCQVSVLMIDRYCSNGCIFSSTEVGTFKRMHVGANLGKIMPLGILPEPKVSSVKLSELTSDVKLAIEAASDQTLFTGYINAVKASVDIKIEEDDPEIIGKYAEVLGKQMGLTKPEQKAVAGRLIDTGDRSLFGVQAAITDMAKYSDSYERKIELESIGAKVFTDIPRRWKTVKALVG